MFQLAAADYKSELRDLVNELMLLFLELLRTLVEAPEAYAGPLARVMQALAAAQHLVNMARPDQVCVECEGRSSKL